MAPTRLIQLSVWETRVDGPYQPRGIKSGDWRDPDETFDFTGCQVYAVDENTVAADTDWSKGWYLMRGDRQAGFSGTGEPPAPFLKAFLEGRVLYGALIARDEQEHG